MKTIHRKKISKNMTKSLNDQTTFGDLLKRFFVVWFLMFFCALVITQQESFWIKVSNTPQEVVFVLPGTPSQWGVENIPSGTHGAATDWSYLFDDTSNSTSNNSTSETTTSLQTTTSNSSQDIPLSEVSLPKDYLPADEEDVFSEDVPVSSLSSGTAILTSGVQNSGITVVSVEQPVCITPWGEYVAPEDFVLAYQQRKDVSNLCDVQKRYCAHGKLTGTYSQKSCKENTLYSYVKPEAVSYSQKPVDPFVQPTGPSLSGADFDTHGKINGTTSSIDTWGSQGSGIPSASTSTTQDLKGEIKCVTPWGEPVKNGQFVKAYKSSIGLIDVPCDVEIRLCVKGKLKGSYTNRTCTFKKMTYRDYLVGNYNENQPTIGDLANTLSTQETETKYTTSSFWKWLDKYF